MTAAVLPSVMCRPATAADERLMRSLFADTREEFFLLDPDVRDALLDMQYRARRRQVAELAPTATRAVLLVDGAPVGFIETEAFGAETVVIDLVVAYSQRHRGVATAALLDLVRAQRPVEIRVRPAGGRFGEMLERIGFEPVDEADGRVRYRFQP